LAAPAPRDLLARIRACPHSGFCLCRAGPCALPPSPSRTDIPVCHPDRSGGTCFIKSPISNPLLPSGTDILVCHPERSPQGEVEGPAFSPINRSTIQPIPPRCSLLNAPPPLQSPISLFPRVIPIPPPRERDLLYQISNLQSPSPQWDRHSCLSGVPKPRDAFLPNQSNPGRACPEEHRRVEVWRRSPRAGHGQFPGRGVLVILVGSTERSALQGLEDSSRGEYRVKAIPG